MAKKEVKKYYPSKLNLDEARFCIERDIAFIITKVSFTSDYYYIEKYKPSNYKERNYLRRNFKVDPSFENRLKLKEYDAWVKMFEYYHKTKLSLEGKTEQNKKEYVKQIEIPKQLNNQIDLFEMIKAVESENSNNKN